jgi:putative phosphoribosyl transferase
MRAFARAVFDTGQRLLSRAGQNDHMYFDDRDQAARMLAEALRKYRGASPLVLAIPRGAVPMGRIIADALGGELDVALVMKLQSPWSGELAVGSIDENGWTYIADYARDIGVDDEYLEEERRDQMDALKLRRALYTPWRDRLDPAGRVVIVVDDGLATGATMIAALHSARVRNPAKLVCAAPVASREALARIGSLADEIVCLETPVGFQSVSQVYRRFDQVSDGEVVAILRAGPPPAPAKRNTRAASGRAERRA